MTHTTLPDATLPDATLAPSASKRRAKRWERLKQLAGHSGVAAMSGGLAVQPGWAR